MLMLCNVTTGLFEFDDYENLFLTDGTVLISASFHELQLLLVFMAIFKFMNLTSLSEQ